MCVSFSWQQSLNAHFSLSTIFSDFFSLSNDNNYVLNAYFMHL